MQLNSDNSVKTLFIIIAIIILLSFINIIFSIFTVKFLKDQASIDSVDKSIKLNYAAAAFGGIIIIISGILMYQLNKSLQTSNYIPPHLSYTNPLQQQQSQIQQQQQPQRDEDSFIRYTPTLTNHLMSSK